MYTGAMRFQRRKDTDFGKEENSFSELENLSSCLLAHQNLYLTNFFLLLVRFFPTVPAGLSLFCGCLK